MHFFTVRLCDPTSDLLIRHIDLLRLSVRLSQLKHGFTILDAVILPDRLHMIWALPPQDNDFSLRWQAVKSTFARHIPKESLAMVGNAIWKRGSWERAILSFDDLVF